MSDDKKMMTNEPWTDLLITTRRGEPVTRDKASRMGFARFV